MHDAAKKKVNEVERGGKVLFANSDLRATARGGVDVAGGGARPWGGGAVSYLLGGAGGGRHFLRLHRVEKEGRPFQAFATECPVQTQLMKPLGEEKKEERPSTMDNYNGMLGGHVSLISRKGSALFFGEKTLLFAIFGKGGEETLSVCDKWGQKLWLESARGCEKGGIVAVVTRRRFLRRDCKRKGALFYELRKEKGVS